MTPDLLDTSKLIVGASGSGKTVTAKAEVAQLLDDGRQVVVIDPTGVWWGMRSTPDGDRAGYDLPIFGGDHGDLPIRPDQGGDVAAIILEQRVSAIVDLSRIDNSADWRGFMEGFVGGLRRGVRGNFHLVVDEADEFAAERAADSAGFALRENLIWIAKRGRAQGFVPTWITQRPADIAKAVISQAQTIIAHQLILAHDQKAIDDYLKSKGLAEVRREVMGSLAELEVGERWIYSPRLKLLERGCSPAPSTFDSSRTPAPGERLAAPRMLAQLDVSAIAAALSAPIGADLPDDVIPADPAAAYAKGGAVGGMIAERDRRIADLEAANALLTATAEAVAAERDTLRAAVVRARRFADQARESAEHCYNALARLEQPDQEAAEKASAETGARSSRSEDEVKTFAAAANSPRGATIAVGRSTREDAPSADMKALAGLAAVYPAGLTEAAWATRTGYARKGGAWIRRRGRYRDDGLIEQRDGRWYATAAGVAAAGDAVPTMPPPGKDLVAWWAARLGAPGRLLKILADVHPRALTRDALAAEATMAPKGGAFIRHVGELKAAELVTDNKKRLAIAPGLMGDA